MQVFQLYSEFITTVKIKPVEIDLQNTAIDRATEIYINT